MLRLIIRTAVMVTGLNALTTFGEPTSFTYQGQLKQQGWPLADLVDMRFTLFTSEAAEASVAGPIVFDGLAFPAIQVTNGLFSVELDFGAEAFQQGGQWLQVEVRAPHDPNDLDAYTTLTPRQHITAAPFALSVPGLATNEAGVEVEGDIHAVGEIAASAYTSNSPFIIKVNPLQMECARFDDADCYMGLGIADPQARLHVGGVAGVDGIMFPDGSMQTTAAGGAGGDGFWSASGSNIYSNNGGKVGVGATDPHHRLRISGGPSWTSNFWTGSLELDNASAIGWRSNAAGRRFGIGQTNTGLYFFHTASDPGTTGSPAVYDMVINDAGNVAIGTGATGTSKFEISASGEGAELLRFTTERPWVFRQIRTGPSAGLQLYSTVGQKAFEITANDGNNVATFVADSGFSRVGIGTTAPISRLDIAAQDGLGITGYQPFLTLRDSNAGNARGRIQSADGSIAFFSESSFITGTPSLSLDHFTTTTHCADFRMGHASRRGSPGRALVDNSDHLVLNFGNDWGYTYVHGRLKVGILEIAGADVAEKFPSSDGRVEPGTVMEIDPDNPGQLRVTREAYSSRVAGVVSGAGDIPMGAVLGNLPGHENAPAIALSGRVWVRCDASQAAITPGDMLTTSDTPGHAMKAVDRNRSHGAVLGKAMSVLAKGEQGLVLVLVNLQ